MTSSLPEMDNRWLFLSCTRPDDILSIIHIHRTVIIMETENRQWEELNYEEKNHELFLRQKALLDEFLEHGAISQAQEQHNIEICDKSILLGR